MSKTAKIMSLSVVAICIVLFIAGLIVINLSATVSEAESVSQFALGLVLGAIHSILKIIMMEKSLNRIADVGDETQGKHVKTIGQVAFIGRYVITAVVLVIGAVVPFLGLFGTIAGIVSLRFAAYLTVAIENRIEKKQAD